MRHTRFHLLFLVFLLFLHLRGLSADFYYSPSPDEDDVRIYSESLFFSLLTSSSFFLLFGAPSALFAIVFQWLCYRGALGRSVGRALHHAIDRFAQCRALCDAERTALTADDRVAQRSHVLLSIDTADNSTL